MARVLDYEQNKIYLPVVYLFDFKLCFMLINHMHMVAKYWYVYTRTWLGLLTAGV